MPDSWDDLMGGPPAATAERVDSWDQLLGGPPVQARLPDRPPIEPPPTSTRGSSPVGPDMFDLRSSELGPMPSRPRPPTAYQDVARAYNASGTPEASGSLGVFGRTAIPFASSAAQLVETGAHSAAQQRARAGEASPEDYALLRNYPRQRQEEQDHPWAAGLGGVVSFVGEAAGGGTLVKGIGAGAKSLLARVAGGVGRAAATTTVMPATYANWAQKNEGEGRDPFDVSTLPANVAYGTMQQAVLGTVGKLAGKIPGEGVSGALGRFGARFTGGMAEMNAVDAAAGKVSEYLPDAMKLRTGYGAFSDLLKEKDGALREFVLQGLTIGAFSAAHGIGEATEQSKQNRRARAEATVEAMRESLDTLSRKGYSKGLAAETLQPAIDALREAAEQDLPPDLSKLPDGPAKELAEKVAEQLPKAATAAPGESPDSPETAKGYLSRRGYSDRQLDAMSAAEARDTVAYNRMAESEADDRVTSPGDYDPDEWAHRQSRIRETEEAVKSGSIQLPENPQPFTVKRPSSYQPGVLERRVDDLMEWAKSEGISEKEAIRSLQDDIKRGEIKDQRGVWHQDVLDHLKRRGFPVPEVVPEERQLGLTKPQLGLNRPHGQLPHEEVPTPVEAFKRKYEAGESVQMEGLYSAAGLTGQERHVMEQRLLGRTHDDIASDPEMKNKKGGRYTRQRVKQFEQNALSKIGEEHLTMAGDVHGQERADREIALLEKAKLLRRGDLSADPKTVKKVKQRVDQEQQEQERLIEQWKQDNGITQEDWEAAGEKSPGTVPGVESRGGGEPAATVRGTPGQLGEPAPVRRAGPEAVPPRPPGAADQGARPPAEGIGQGADTAAGGEAAGNVVIPPATQARLNEAMRTGDKPVVDDLKELLKQHYDDETARAAVKAAGKMGPVKPKQGTWMQQGLSAQMSGNQRKYYAEMQFLQELAEHEGRQSPEAVAELQRGQADGLSEGVRAADAAARNEPLPPETPGEDERPESGPGSVPAEVAPGVHFFGGPGQPGGQPGGAAGQPAGSPGGRGTAGGSLSQAVAAPIDAKAAGRAVLRPEIARKQRRADVAAAALDKGEEFFQGHIEAQSPDVQKQRFLDFYVPIETGKDVPPEQKPFADTYKDLKGDYTAALVDNGLIESTIANHVGHLYRDPRNPNATPESIMASILGRRPLTGKEGFRRERRGDLPTWQEAIDAGFEPRSWNPMTQAKMEFDQYSKSLFGHAVFDQFKEQGLAVYMRLGQRPPEGMSQVEDKLFRVLAPGEARVKEYFDKQQTEGLEKFAADNNIKIRTAMAGPIGQQTPGEVVRRFGTPEEVVMHEIGHELEQRYGLDSWARNPSLQPELEKLADLRSSGRTSPQQAASLRDPSEWVANLFAGYLHAPELTQKVAPNAFSLLDSFLSSHKETAPLRDIKPSLELGERDQNLRLAGPMLTGHYYLPDAVAKDTNNYMSPGLSSVRGPGGSVYRAFRGFGNHMTQFLLGVSGFHAVETAIYAQASAAAEAGNMALRGDFKEAVKKLPEALIPGAAAVKGVWQGLKIRREWDMPGSQSPEVQQQAKLLEEMGGRARGGSDYMTNSLAQLGIALRRIKAGDYGQIPRALWHALPALNEAFAKPTMDYLVPLTKMSVGMDAAKYEMAKMAGAEPGAKAEVLRKIWDQMDDRLGLVTHDNLFWNRVMRDVVHTSFLSFGWNMGDVRGLGGGLVDALRPSQWQGLAKGEGFSRRTGFLIAMMGTTAAYGALYQLAATGKPPEEPKDLWFPKTGRFGKDGTPERMAFPTNMKDLANSVNRAGDSPLQIPRNIYGMAKGKLSPAVKLVGDILENRDWSNSMIDNPNETWARQGKNLGMHILSAFEPIGVKQFFDQRKKGAGVGQQLQGFAGITPAPYGISHTDEQLRAMERNKSVELTPLQKKVRKGR